MAQRLNPVPPSAALQPINDSSLAPPAPRIVKVTPSQSPLIDDDPGAEDVESAMGMTHCLNPVAESVPSPPKADDDPGAENVDVAQLREELASAKEILSKLEDKLGPEPQIGPPCCITRVLICISVFGPTWWGGVLTILCPIVAGCYLYYLISKLLDVEDYISFLEIGVMSDLPDLNVTFTCSAPPGCRACTLPCTGGTTIVDIAAGESAVLALPFFVIQNAYFITADTIQSYELGLTSAAQKDPTTDGEDNILDLQVAQASEWWTGVPLGHITGPTGAGAQISVALQKTPPTGSTSSKTIVTSKTLVNGTSEVALAPDGSDCTKAELSTCSDLKGGILSEQLLLPPIPGTIPGNSGSRRTGMGSSGTGMGSSGTGTGSSGTGMGSSGTGNSGMDLMTQHHCYCTTVCSASFYIKTEVVRQDLGSMVVATVCISSLHFVLGLFGRTASGLGSLSANGLGGLFSCD